MTSIKIDFVDFWPNFVKSDNYFYHLLRTKFDVEVSESNPDLVFFSCYSSNKLKYIGHKCKKIFYTGENRGLLCYNGSNWITTQFLYDLTFTFDETNGNNVYLPLFIMFLNWFHVPHDDNRDISYLCDIDNLINPPREVPSKSKLCAFIVGNDTAKFRIDFCRAVQRSIRVDCPGRVLNNCPPIGGRGDQKHKIEFLKDYRFNIAFENSYHAGYVTEKILHALSTRCIPIYWGGIKALKYFNNGSFIFVNDTDADKIVDTMLNINNNKERYEDMIMRPVLNDNVMTEFAPAVVIEHIMKAIS